MSRQVVCCKNNELLYIMISLLLTIIATIKFCLNKNIQQRHFFYVGCYMFSFKKNFRIKKIFVGAVGASSALENHLSSPITASSKQPSSSSVSRDVGFKSTVMEGAIIARPDGDDLDCSPPVSKLAMFPLLQNSFLSKGKVSEKDTELDLSRYPKELLV